MKKLITVLGMTVALAASVQAQGTIYLNNYDNDGLSSSASGNTAIWLGALGTSAPTGNTFVEVLAGASAGSLTALVSTTTTSAIIAANSTGGAYGSGTVGNYFDGGYGVVNGVGASGTAFLEVLAWSGASTYALAQTTAGAYTGSTAVWSQTIGSTVPAVGAPSPATLLMPTDIVMSITQVPEPTTLALAGLGGFGMLMALRRKQA